MPNLYLPVTATVISLIILIVYLSKKRLRVKENSLYLLMLIFILLDSILVSSIFINVYVGGFNKTLIVLLNRFDYMCLFGWSSCLFLYTYIVLHKDEADFQKKYDIVKLVVAFVSLVMTALMWHFEVELVYIDILRCTAQGSAVYFSIAACVVFFVASFIMILINAKKINKRVIPVFICLIITGTIAGLFTINPYLICISIGLTTVNLTMFFTIENPDMQMLEEVNEAKNEAMRANQAKTDFLSAMSHEIRTPLNAIVGLSECIMKNETLEEDRDDAKYIINATQTLLEIVNGILDISKIEAGKMEIVNSEYDLQEVSENIVRIVRTRIGEKPIAMNVSFSKDIPGVLFGDEAKVRQIITNILTNAIKYTEEGHINFNIECENADGIANLTISIEDTGRGLKEEQIEKLFEKYRRFEEVKNSKIEGTGLGLAITKRLIEMMNGQINVKSRYGEGTTFVVTLPQEIRSMERKIKEEVKKVSTTYPDKNILIVDDNNLNIMIEKRLLGFYKLNIDSASSGQECIEKCKTKKYDLILMDDMMPEMNGTETMKTLKEDSSFDTPIAVLTANAIEGARETYFDDGFDEFLSKPIDNDEMQRVLNLFLASHPQPV